ncbi:helix-turn-helix domain-containing protein [Serratia marcescens]|uniref:helix-turn-helix domain-containing protein n=1 Tax=Serratia marcescens TaxID=615 RepID=UPI000C1B6F99|nr:XRE family transcriptional regulator [Serratia marcescens]PIN56595.1 XRE family transcriptional regulator [Serratia marcescens]POP22434.1 XRE family transcriptional regulator [Serratia marcescens]POP27090.1 XRE family transcriptional regulator [Serratia marcescens]WLS89933.1 XRE family transcriptional regulator [Serratia marcescens]
MQELAGHLAHTLRTLRAQRGWSLTQAAEYTGVSKAMLGQIERGESSPTVATLWKIATGFNVAFSAFLEASPAQQQATLHRYGDLPVYDQDNADMRVVPLFPYDRQLGFDMFVIDLAPGAFSESSPHEPGVIEHVIVISGRLELAIDGAWHSLAAGEAMRFQADRPHAYRNAGSQTVRIHDLIHYPQS